LLVECVRYCQVGKSKQTDFNGYAGGAKDGYGIAEFVVRFHDALLMVKVELDSWISRLEVEA